MNNATFLVQRRDSGGGGNISVAKLTTNFASGGMTAFAAKSLGTVTKGGLSVGQTLTLRISKGGDGVTVSAGMLVVTYAMT